MRAVASGSMESDNQVKSVTAAQMPQNSDEVQVASLETANRTLQEKIALLRDQISEVDEEHVAALAAIDERRVKNQRRAEFWAACALPEDHAIYVCSDDSQDEDERVGGPSEESATLLQLGLGALDSDLKRTAKRHFKHSALKALQAGDKKSHTMACIELSKVYASEGKYDKCHVLMQYWLGLVREMKDKVLEGVVLGEAVSCAMALGQYDEALGYSLRKLILASSEEETSEASDLVDKVNAAIDTNANVTVNSAAHSQADTRVNLEGHNIQNNMKEEG
jgi:hypothetical protein